MANISCEPQTRPKPAHTTHSHTEVARANIRTAYTHTYAAVISSSGRTRAAQQQHRRLMRVRIGCCCCCCRRCSPLLTALNARSRLAGFMQSVRVRARVRVIRKSLMAQYRFLGARTIHHHHRISFGCAKLLGSTGFGWVPLMRCCAASAQLALSLACA